MVLPDLAFSVGPQDGVRALPAASRGAMVPPALLQACGPAHICQFYAYCNCEPVATVAQQSPNLTAHTPRARSGKIPNPEVNSDADNRDREAKREEERRDGARERDGRSGARGRSEQAEYGIETRGKEHSGSRRIRRRRRGGTKE
ncbi:hypothetical protein NDU88_004576 [Pleurodeles waltl]|uniref:Uncharacterized protein n=1 Tax=Pleurodeles waltl TaxID=8319 RepID=A0AAV7V1M4_PLEWA|nr:hypothetical protein NDU88_004576 [Pleurodeles waltl]